MINANDIEELMRRSEITNFDIFNVDGGRLFSVDKDTIESCCAEWIELKRFLSNHRKLILRAGNKDTARGKGVAKFTWEFFFEENNKSNAPQQQQQMGYYGANANFDSHPLLNAKMRELELTNEINNLKNGMGKKGDDDSDDKWIDLLGKILPEMFGKKDASNLHGPDDLDVKDKDDQQKQIELLERLMEQVCKKVDVKSIIKLLQAINRDPKLVDKALNFLG